MENFNDVPAKKIYSGKVRELYDLENDRILMVATDRISAFDHVLPTPVPGKGIILTQMSLFWFKYLENIIGNHVIEENFEKFPSALQKCHGLKGRSLIVKKAERLPVECVVRGYLAGSGWKEYVETGKVCGIKLPEGLKESSKISEPIFTPATKEDKGSHDVNISYAEMEKITGKETASLLKEKSLKLYESACKYALQKGIIIADTKFEFGFYKGNLILIDEVFTPDSSRFWEANNYSEGSTVESLDKQYIRNYLLKTKWDKNSAPPGLPENVILKTRQKYKQAYEILTGMNLENF